MRWPVIALVGRPNVGKSTLFNRIARRRISIVEDVPGVTRDRLYAEVERDDMRFTLIDTGGFEPDPKTKLLKAMREQTQLAIEEADVIVFLVDARAGLVPADTEVASLLRGSSKPVIVAANKADSPKVDGEAYDFYQMGVDRVVPISAEHGRGVGELIDDAWDALPADLREGAEAALEEGRVFDERLEWDDALDEAEAALESEAEQADGDGEVAYDENGEPIVVQPVQPVSQPKVVLPDVLRLAIIGKPNAGKSSLVNKLLGEDRHLVSDMPGTTMDAVDSFFEYGGRRFRLIDTAGIRRKRSISLKMEKFAVVSALKAMDRADVALLLIDAMEGLTEQDLKIASFAHEKGLGIVVVVNKWDLGRQDGLNAEEYKKDLRYRMPFLAYAPIRFVSALTGRRVFDLLDTVEWVAEQHFTRIPTGQVNKTLQMALNAHQPPVVKSRRVKIFFGTQVAVAPPTFVFATNSPADVHFSYRRYLLNKFRETFNFEGTPIRMVFKSRSDPDQKDAKRMSGNGVRRKSGRAKSQRSRKKLRR